MINETFFLDLEKKDVVSALLISSIVTHSYEVETTRHIVTLWADLRNNLKLDGEKDVIAAILANGRLLDIKEDIKNPDVINNLIHGIACKIVEDDIFVDPFTHMSYNAALLSSAIIAKSTEIETTKSMLDIYRVILEEIKAVGKNAPTRTIAAILSWGRILEHKGTYRGIKEVTDIYRYLCNEVATQAEGTKIFYNEYGAAFMAAAYVEISPKVERIRDIIGTWDILRWEVEIGSKIRYIAAILASGRVRDMSASELSLPQSSLQLINQIEGLLKAVYSN